MSLLLHAARDAQAPRYLTAPPRASSSGAEVIELAASAGLFLDPWQQADLEVACGERADGKWAAFEVALLNQRQNGKGAELQARQLAGLFLFGEPLQTHTAHRVDACLEHFKRMKDLIDGCPDLSRRVRRVCQTNGAEAIELVTGERLIFKARSKASGRGFSGRTIYLDEALYLFIKTIGGMIPTMSAQPNPQLWYASSPPLDSEESEVLRRLCRRGRAGTSESLAFIEYSAQPDAAMDDRDAWAEANPSLGVPRADGTGISEEFIEFELASLPEEEFRRERLGIWIDPDESDDPDQVLDRVAWADCMNEASVPTDEVRLALDVSVDRRWSTFGVASPTPAGKHIELADRLPGTAAVVARAVALTEAWGGPLYVAAKSPAASLIPDLTAAGVEVREVTTDEHARACADLFDEVLERRIHHVGDGILDAAVKGAERRYYGDAWLWSRRNSKVDICPLVAVTLAAWAVGQPADEKVVSLW